MSIARNIINIINEDGEEDFDDNKYETIFNDILIPKGKIKEIKSLALLGWDYKYNPVGVDGRSKILIKQRYPKGLKTLTPTGFMGLLFWTSTLGELGSGNVVNINFLPTPKNDNNFELLSQKDRKEICQLIIDTNDFSKKSIFLFTSSKGKFYIVRQGIEISSLDKNRTLNLLKNIDISDDKEKGLDFIDKKIDRAFLDKFL